MPFEYRVLARVKPLAGPGILHFRRYSGRIPGPAKGLTLVHLACHRRRLENVFGPGDGHVDSHRSFIFYCSKIGHMSVWSCGKW